jgi:hypothetical protein
MCFQFLKQLLIFLSRRKKQADWVLVYRYDENVQFLQEMFILKYITISAIVEEKRE